MQSNLLYYLWNQPTEEPDKLQSLDGTPDMQYNKTAFKAIASMLQSVEEIKSDKRSKQKEPKEMLALNYMWYTPNQLNTMFNENKVWCLKSNKEETLLNQHRRIYDQIKMLGLFIDVQNKPKKFTIGKLSDAKPKLTIKKLAGVKQSKHARIRVFVNDDSDIDMKLQDSDSDYYDCFSDDEVFTRKSIAMCKPELSRDIIGKDNALINIIEHLKQPPKYFRSTNIFALLPYFEDLNNREEVETLLHYYKSKAYELDIDAMKPGMFIVEKEVDKLYKDMYDKDGKFEKKLQSAIARLDSNPSYQLWEREYLAICKEYETFPWFRYSVDSKEQGKRDSLLPIVKKRRFKKKMQYQMNIIREEFTQWLEMYKKNNYVPYKFLIKYFK